MGANADALTWLADHQRAQCDGRSALTTFQGMLVDEIVAPQSSFDAENPGALVHATAAFCRQMQNGAMLLPGEFAQEAMWSFHVEFYRLQVAEGGHAQYVANSGWAPVAVRCCGYGLKSMVADPHHEILRQLAKYTQAEQSDARKLAKANGFRNVEAAIADLDKRFAALEASEPLLARHKTWLKSLRKLKVVPDGEIIGHLKRIAASNPLRGRRQAETVEAQRERDANDPARRAVREMCELAGLRFSGSGRGAVGAVQSVWPEGPAKRGFAVAAATDQGARTAVFFVEGGLMKKRKAVLIEPGKPLPVADMILDRGAFEDIVPEAARTG